MDIYGSLFSSSGMLNEQIAKEIFGIMPVQGPFIVILDGKGNYWASDEERFSQIFSDKQQLEQVISRIDDGGDPVISQIDDSSIVATQLATDQTNCGYVILVLEEYSPESTFANMDLIELLLNQIGLVARLIEKNNHLRHTQMKRLSLVSDN